MGAEPVLDEDGIARRHGARRALRCHLDDEEPRTRSLFVQDLCNALDSRPDLRSVTAVAKPRGTGDSGEIDAAARYGSPACLSRRNAGCRSPRWKDCAASRRDGGEAAEPHQLLAVAGDDQHRPLRLRQGQAEPDQSRHRPWRPRDSSCRRGRRPHARHRSASRGRSRPADPSGPSARRRPHRGASVSRRASSHSPLLPAEQALADQHGHLLVGVVGEVRRARCTVSTRSSGASARSTFMPIASRKAASPGSSAPARD